MNIGERIKLRRKELRMSVDELANLLGKNRTTIYRYESNDIENLPLNLVEPLAAALKTTPGYLTGWNVAAGQDSKNGMRLELLRDITGSLFDFPEEKLTQIKDFVDFVKTK